MNVQVKIISCPKIPSGRKIFMLRATRVGAQDEEDARCREVPGNGSTDNAANLVCGKGFCSAVRAAFWASTDLPGGAQAGFFREKNGE